MQIITKLILCVISLAALSSCASLIDANRSVNTTALQIGMSKAQVQQALNKKPDGIISAKKDPQSNATIEVVEYSQQYYGERVNRYWLYFANDKLDRWEPANKYYQPSL
jgi:hypothetical protein